jgi:MFS family permease
VTVKPGPDATGGVHRGLALLVAGAFFMEILDGTVIAPAAPHIAADLGIPAVAVNIAISGYVLTLAVLIPTSGWLADRFGARRVFGTAYLTWPALLAPVIAPALSGILSTYASWRWIFVINVPLGVAGLLLARRLVPDVRAPEPPPLDGRGFALTAIGVAALVVGLEDIGGAAPNPTVTAIALVLAAVSLGTAVRYLLRTRRPLLDLRILRVPTYRNTALSGSVFRAVISAVPFLLSLLFQLGFGWTAAEAGLVVIALFAGNVGIKPLTTPLMRRFGIRTVMVCSVAGAAATLVGIAFLQASTPLPVILALLALSGVFRSVGFTTYNSVAFADVAPERMTSANTLMSTLQELGAGLGVAVGALLVRLGEPVARTVGLGSGADQPFRVAFVLLAVVLLEPLAQGLRLSRAAGNEVTGRA